MSEKRVVVVGGGLAGLTAAFRLQQRGARVVVLEAESRLGGRAFTDELDGFRIDAGAQLVGSMYEEFMALVREIGLRNRLVRVPGRDALWRDGRAHEVVYGSVTSMATSGGLPLTTKMRLGATYVPFLTRNAASLSLHEPERAAVAGLDGEAIAVWGEREIDGAFVRNLVYPQLGAFYNSLPEETSAGFYHILARHGMDVTLYAFAEGIGEVAQKLMQRIIAGGGEVRCDCRVDGIELRDDRQMVEVVSDGRAERFDGAVAAVPAPTLHSILTGAPALLIRWLSRVRYRPTLSLALLLERAPDVRYFGLSFPQGDTRYLSALCLQENKHAALVPEGKGLLVAFPTPETAATLVELESRGIVDRLLPEITRALPIRSADILRARVYRWPVGTPIFSPGYLEHLRRFRSTNLEENGILAVAGEYLYSPSVEGAVTSGGRAADRLAGRLGLGRGDAGPSYT